MTDDEPWLRFSLSSLVAGFLVGAAVSLAIGIWLAIGTQREIVSGQGLLRQQVDALLSTNVAGLVSQAEARRILEGDLALLRERVATIEAKTGNFVASAEALRTIDRHLSAIDGRQDGIDTRMRALEEQITGTRGKVDAALAASGKRK